MDSRGGAEPQLRPAARTGSRRRSSCSTTPRWRRPEAALARLCDPAAEVSAHYLVAEDGRVVAARRRGGAGLARRGGELARCRRRQLALDRDRARQRRAAGGLPAVPRAADGGARDVARRHPGAVGDPAVRGDRPFRHGAGAQGRSGAEVRLAAPGGAAGGRSGAAAGAGQAGWDAFRAAAMAAGYPGGAGAAEEGAVLLTAARLRLRPWARSAEPEAEDTGALLALAALHVDATPRGA